MFRLLDLRLLRLLFLGSPSWRFIFLLFFWRILSCFLPVSAAGGVPLSSSGAFLKKPKIRLFNCNLFIFSFLL